MLSQEFSEGTEAGLVSEVCLCEEQELAQEIPNAEVPSQPHHDRVLDFSSFFPNEVCTSLILFSTVNEESDYSSNKEEG